MTPHVVVPHCFSPRRSGRFPVKIRKPFLIAAAALQAGLTPILFAAEATAASASVAPQEARDFVVFMGLDVTVPGAGESSKVVQADQKSVHVERRGQRVRLSLNDAPNFKVTVEPKISNVSIELAEVSGKAVDSRGAARARDALAQQVMLDTLQQHTQELADAEFAGAIANMEGVARAEQTQMGVPAAVKAAANQRMNEAMQGMSNAYGSALGGGFQPGTENMNKGGDVPDSFEVSCRISSPVPIDNAYALLRLMVRDASGPTMALKFFPLPRLDEKPRRLVLTQSGLPPGFVIERFDVHVYADGREIATNASSNRMQVSQEEAYQFALLRHVSQNRNATLPMQALPDLTPKEAFRALSADQLSRTVDIEVDETGVVSALAWDGGAGTAVNEGVDAVLRAIRFLPALQNGKPTASRGTFALSELVTL